MKIEYTRRALSDLEEIADYLAAESPLGARRVLAAIRTALANIAAFPRLGRRQSAEGVRKLATRRFPYLIYYSFDQTADEVVILTIRHAAQGRDFTEA